MTSGFSFRKRSSLGGLAADLEAELKQTPQPPEHGVRVYRDVWLTLPQGGIHWQDLAWLAFGASLMARQLTDAHPGGVQVQVNGLTYPLADYRPEVAAVCMAGWLARELGVADPGVTVRADPERGAYVFEWGDLVGDPFTY
ncbi:hypothetical protein [Streptomyces sp. SYSU K217416]